MCQLYPFVSLAAKNSKRVPNALKTVITGDQESAIRCQKSNLLMFFGSSKALRSTFKPSRDQSSKFKNGKLPSYFEPEIWPISSRFKLRNDLRTTPFCWQKSNSYLGQTPSPTTVYTFIDLTEIQLLGWLEADKQNLQAISESKRCLLSRYGKLWIFLNN